MKISRYSQKSRTECLLSAKNAYKILLEKEKSEGSPLFRTREEMIAAKLKKNRASSDWWKSSTNVSKQFTSVLFVPPTPGGELAKRLKKRESELNSGHKMNIKIIEKGGIKVKTLGAQPGGPIFLPLSTKILSKRRAVASMPSRMSIGFDVMQRRSSGESPK